DALDLRRERLEGSFLFVVESVPVIDASNAANHMPQRSLGVVRWHTRAAHEGSRGAAQVMDSPASHATGFVELILEAREPANRVLAVVGEHPAPGAERGNIVQQSHGGGR